MKKLLNFTKLVSFLQIILAVNVFAQEAKPPQPNPLGSFFPLIVIFFIFYFLLIRPQQKKAKEHKTMLNSLKKDDKIITNGGIYATVVAIKGNILEIKISENVRIQIDKNAIAGVINNDHQTTVTPEIVK